MNQTVLIENRAGLRIITMNRPEARNALNAEMAQALLGALNDAATDPAVRAVVLTGAGGTFCVGGDVKAMHDGTSMTAVAADRVGALRSRMDASRLLHEMSKPTVAAIEGAAAGAGLSLALACDFRICSTEAKITTAFAKVGLSGDFGGTYFLTQMVGAAKARELYLLSPLLMGAEAWRLGLVTRTEEPGQALDAALELGAQLAAGPTLTLGRMKANLNAAEGGAGLADCLDTEAENHIGAMETADHREAAAAFVAKRAPVFTGR